MTNSQQAIEQLPAQQLPLFDTQIILNHARRVLTIEAEAITRQIEILGHEFIKVVTCILACQGHVVLFGIGKSGHIARKMAATLSSTGTSSYFMHATEASHGDLGAIKKNDIVIVVSNSGENVECLSILPAIRHIGCKIVAITSKPQSTLAKSVDLMLEVFVEQEACPLNLAPTASSTATLALGDALAISLLVARGFNPEDFARSHPGGLLGRRLLTRVGDIMHVRDEVPTVPKNTNIVEALLAMTKEHFGMVVIADNKHACIDGLFTDGDLRRLLASTHDLKNIIVGNVMTSNPRTILPTCLATEAARLMSTFSINQLIVIDENKQLVGLITLHDLMHHRIT